ncbi:uncharacterized protein LOC116378450, partial [Anarrhichthys ocellatus]|uniref:uncharacterized protein LOC116378450 n=1 Tax=Anarrhichthys ocellatus TaxID=433405 RepID=UPI0012EE13C7
MPGAPAEPPSHQKRTAKPLYNIFTSSPISTCFKKPIFKEKAASNSSQHLETSNHSEHQDKQQISTPQTKTEAACLKQGAGDRSIEIKVEPHRLALEPSTETTPPSCESELPSKDNPDKDEEEEEEEGEEDQSVFFTPELFGGEDEEGTPQKETKTKSPPRMLSGAESPTLLSEERFGSEQARGQGPASASDGQSAISVREESIELTQKQQEEVIIQKQGEEGEQSENQSRQTGSRLRRLSRSRKQAPSTPTGGGCGAKRAGKVSLQQIETRSSQRRTRPDHELKVVMVGLNSRPSRDRLIREYSSKKDTVQENVYQAHFFKPSVIDRGTESGRCPVGVREHKALKTPASSTRTETDDVTPKQGGIGGLQEAGAARCSPTSPAADGPGTQHTTPKAVELMWNWKEYKLTMAAALKTLITIVKEHKPCSLGLYCSLCEKELLPVAHGSLRSAFCEFEHLAFLRKIFSSATTTRRCQCAPHQPSLLDDSGSLLVVQSLTAMKALRTALQPYCDSSLTAYNAIWNPEEGSVTRLLQCSGCLSQSPFLSAALIAAEIQWPRDMAQDQ